ncbi:methyltransferase [Nesterenkonia jeotgali]|uniref:Uncharacterized protein n=1 Tax=Nesterenkonia jeotgali TaxID=317018 RepID=A0A0W8ICU0_9MICC|nr:methyltransferase [Nesterenkonia jeotgali]KUG57584.1 hypothetical protein AVL63_13170 [Nesterenkonia jeotgali]
MSRADRAEELPAPVADRELIAALRADLDAARFTNERIAQLLSADALAALDRDQFLPAELELSELLAAEPVPDPCAVLAQLWLLGHPIPAGQLQAALPQVGVQGLRRLNLVHQVSGEPERGERYRPSVDLQPYHAEQAKGLTDLWVLSDLPAAQRQDALHPEHVLGIGGASLTLAASIHRAPVARALEIGTGCGIQLMHLLDHAEHVVATDLSPRALAFTEFNLGLNAPALDLDPEDLGARVELLQGSLLEPVAGRRFDLIVSNPPFVITPRPADEQEQARYTYRDGGRAGDELMAELISGLPEHLSDSGTAQLLGNWEIQDQDAWDARPRLWCDQLPAEVDAWFIQRDRQDGAEYAETWLRDAATERDEVRYRQRYSEYLQDFASRGVEAVGFGMIWMRRRPSAEAAALPSWRRFEEITGPVEQPLGPVLGAMVSRADAVARDPQAVLGRALVVAPDVTEERHQRFGAEHPEVIIARQGAGLRRTRTTSSSGAGFMGASDGECTAAQLITAVCSLTEADEETLAVEILDLYVEGFLQT